MIELMSHNKLVVVMVLVIIAVVYWLITRGRCPNCGKKLVSYNTGNHDTHLIGVPISSPILDHPVLKRQNEPKFPPGMSCPSGGCELLYYSDAQ